MATVYFSLSRKESAATPGLHEILVRFCHGRINLRAKSGIFVRSEYWDERLQQVVIPRFRIMSAEQRAAIEELSCTQNNLQELQASIMSEFINAGSGKVPLHKNWLSDVVISIMRRRLNLSNSAKSKFFEAWDRFIESKQVSARRKAMFKVVRNMMWRYERVERMRNPSFYLSFDAMTNRTLLYFERFLLEEVEYVDQYPQIYKNVPDRDLPKHRGPNTISHRMAILRTFIIWAIDNELTTNDPFKKYSIKAPVYGTPIYITISERNTLYHAPMPSKRLQVVRDIFVFQCLIGCRVGDLLKLKRQNIMRGAIEYIPHKTKDGRPETVRVPLNDTAKEIIARYDDADREALLPFISAQKYNDYIKECFKIAGLDRYVTVLNTQTRESEQKHLYEVASSHMGRRTFVGNLYKQVKDPNLVGALSGHKEGSKAFARYRDIDEEMKVDLVKLLE
jgi:integrase